MRIPSVEYNRIQELLPILCVDVAMTYEGKCLLLRRLNHPEKGQWWFPGGRILKNELIKVAALRKSFDEVGLKAEFNGILTIEETRFARKETMACDVHTVNICYHLVVKNTVGLKVGSDHDAFQWVDLPFAENLNLHESVIRPLSLCLSKFCA